MNPPTLTLVCGGLEIHVVGDGLRKFLCWFSTSQYFAVDWYFEVSTSYLGEGANSSSVSLVKNAPTKSPAVLALFLGCAYKNAQGRIPVIMAMSLML